MAYWIGQEEGRRRLTLEALADVDSGRVVDHAEVEAWADCLDTPQLNPLPEPGGRAS